MTERDDYEEVEYEIDDYEEYWSEVPSYQEVGNVSTTTTQNTRSAMSTALGKGTGNSDTRVQVTAIMKDGRAVPVFTNKGHYAGIRQDALKKNWNESGFSFKKFIQSETHGYVRAKDIDGFQVTKYGYGEEPGEDIDFSELANEF